MKRLLPIGLLALMSVLAGCHFPQGWHHPRTAARTGSTSTTQTVVYFQNDVVGYQGPIVQWVADKLDGHPELYVRMVDTCPAGRNCVEWDTANINGGLTSISFDSSRHILSAHVWLSTTVGKTASLELSRKIAWHEACHGFGGGWGDAIHQMCNYEHAAHHMADVARVYHDDPG